MESQRGECSMPAEEVSLQVESSAGGIDDGDTVSGTVISSGLKTVETADGDVDYYEIDVAVDGIDNMELTADWPARITESTGLGATLERFGVELVQGKEIALHDVFGVGTEVEFEVETEEAPDDAGVDEYLNIAEGTLRPEGADLDTGLGESNESESEDDNDDDELEEEVLEIVNDHMGEEKSDVVTALSQESNEHVKVFNELAGEKFEVNGGLITPA
jgi:hypothetical protein